MLDLSKIEAALKEALGLASSECLAQNEKRVATSGTDYVYAGAVLCAIHGAPTASMKASLPAAMQARGFSNFTIDASNWVHGTTFSAACSTYPTRDTSCRQSIPNDDSVTATVKGALGVDALCGRSGDLILRETTSGFPYYTVETNCTLGAAPSPAAVAAFTPTMLASARMRGLRLDASLTSVSGTVSSAICTEL
jgi:hypothetical protein